MKDRTPLPELLQWLAEAPRTYGWSAILAYDRDKTNTVLRQEYIERFDNGSYLPPFRELIPTTDDTAEYIYDYVFDAARLSFTNATISHSNAMLTQRVIGGSQLSLKRTTGPYPRVEKVFSLDAMDGPSLESAVSLMASTGHVNRAGEVVLDISTGSNPRLTFARTEHEREAGGKHFMARFGDEEEPKRVLVLNELGVVDDQFLKPGTFEIRTHAAPNSHVRGTAEYGSGAVLAFIAMEGESNGTLPVNDTDFPFLIPDGHSATVLLGQEFYFHRVIMTAFRTLLASGPEYELIRNGNSFITQAQVTYALPFEMYDFEWRDEVYDHLQISRIGLSLAGHGNTFNVFTNDRRLTVELNGHDFAQMIVRLRGDDRYYEGSVKVFWDVRRSYSTEINRENGGIRMKLVEAESYMNFRVEPEDSYSKPPIGDKFQPIADFCSNFLHGFFGVLGTYMIINFEVIDMFRLNSLLFKGDNAAVFDSVHLPGDLALFGHVSPSLTEFVITPLEPIIGHGQRQRFDTEPQRSGVTWSIEALPGESGPVGSIDQNGWYTAPPASAIEGVYKRVKVKATQGQHTSTALVTVVVRDISVNPIVQVCGVGQSRAMSAGTLGDGVLTWEIANPENGATIAASHEPDVDHLYTAGPYIKDAEFIIDEVVVTNSQTKHQQSAYVIVPHGLEGLQVFYEATANPNQVQCKALFANGAPTDGYILEWGLLLGSGSIDGNGLFTLDTAGQHRFAVVSCAWRGPMTMIGYCVLPLPLIPLPDMLKVLGDTDRLFSTPGAAGDEK